MKTEIITVGADMGSVKIGNDDFTACFDNGFGDGYFPVKITEKKQIPKGFDFVGHFTAIKPNSVHIYGYDCNMIATYTFKETGRYFVYNNCGKVLIVKTDNDLHA